MEKKYLVFPRDFSRPHLVRRLIDLGLSGALFLPSWLLAFFSGTPGLGIRFKLFLLGLKLLFLRLEFKEAYRLIVKPLDSVRYFEFEFMNAHYPVEDMHRHLDVSSPRYWLALCASTRVAHVDAMNPDLKDLSQTVSLLSKIHLTDHFSFSSCLISDFPIGKPYDLVTCMSVLEHIPDDKRAVQIMWDALRPGGVLLLTVPCAGKAYEEYTSVDEYQLLPKDRSGNVFWQRFYDERELQERVFCVTGEPIEKAIYGEKMQGLYDENVRQKRTNPSYPFWNEPLWTGLSFERKERIDQLLGMGVVGLVFRKVDSKV